MRSYAKAREARDTSKAHDVRQAREARDSIKPGAQAPGSIKINAIEPAKRATACHVLWAVARFAGSGLFDNRILGLAPQALRLHLLRRLNPGLVMLVLLLSGTVLAHDPGLSAAEVRILPDRMVAEVSFARVDMDQNLAECLLEIKADEQILKLRHFEIQTPDTNSIHFILEFQNTPATELHLSAVAFEQLPRGHKQFLSVRDDEGKILAERMLSAESKDLTITLHTNSGSSTDRFFRFLVLGIEHILTGYDHLAFLLAVLLTGGSLSSNARIITSFTVAHSLTLALATFGVITLPATIVEPLIAASIVFVGIENLVRRQLARRWLVTFGFGLIHGLGFAQILRELGIATLGIQGAIPLLSFNLGVELAQLSIAAVTLPLIWRLQRRPAFMLKHVPALSLLLTLAGIYWFLARTMM